MVPKKGQPPIIYCDTVATFGDHLEQHRDSSKKALLADDNNGSGEPLVSFPADVAWIPFAAGKRFSGAGPAARQCMCRSPCRT